jgi:hypothetical protein
MQAALSSHARLQQQQQLINLLAIGQSQPHCLPKPVQNASRVVVTCATTGQAAAHICLLHPLPSITRWEVVIISIHHRCMAARVVFCHSAAGGASWAWPAVEICVMAAGAESVVWAGAACAAAMAGRADCVSK